MIKPEKTNMVCACHLEGKEKHVHSENSVRITRKKRIGRRNKRCKDRDIKLWVYMSTSNGQDNMEKEN